MQSFDGYLKFKNQPELILTIIRGVYCSLIHTLQCTVMLSLSLYPLDKQIQIQRRFMWFIYLQCEIEQDDLF